MEKYKRERNRKRLIWKRDARRDRILIGETNVLTADVSSAPINAISLHVSGVDDRGEVWSEAYLQCTFIFYRYDDVV